MDNGFDISRFFNTILPIIIFVLWFIISMFANAKKKKQQQQQQYPKQTPQQEETYEGTGYKGEEESAWEKNERERGEDASSTKGSVDDLRRGLETIFTEMGLPPPGSQFPEEQEREGTAQKTDTTTVEDSKKEVRAEPAVVNEYQKAMESMSTKEAITSSSFDHNASPIEAFNYDLPGSLSGVDYEGKNAFDLDSPQELRKGIIYAEILGKPVALREPSYSPD